MSTDRLDSFRTPRETLPSNADVIGPRPREPITITSASIESAAVTISSTVSPETRSNP